MPNRPHRRPAGVAQRTPITQDPTASRTARELGWSPSAQRHGVARGDLIRERRGVLSAGNPIDEDQAWWQQARDAHLRAARAAAVSSPRATISHLAGAVGLGLPVLRVPARPCLTVPAGTALRRVVDAHLHRATLGPDDVVVVGGDTLTAPARTVMDIAREFGVDAATVVADAALHRGLLDERQLTNAFEQCRGWPGRKRAAITLRSVDGRAESPLETLSRLGIHGEGLPTPEPQVRIFDLAGRFLGRCDFYWDEFGVVGEADGDLKYDEQGVSLDAERARQKLFERAGLLVVRWGMRDLAGFGATASQLRVAFGRGAAPASPERRWVARPTPLHPAASPTPPAGGS